VSFFHALFCRRKAIRNAVMNCARSVKGYPMHVCPLLSLPKEIETVTQHGSAVFRDLLLFRNTNRRVL
jgi:hypothetical protein